MVRAAAVVVAVGLLAGCAPDRRDVRAVSSSSSASSFASSFAVEKEEPRTTSTSSSTVPAPVEREAPVVSVVVPAAPTSTSSEASVTVGGGSSLGVFEATCYALRGTTASGTEAGPGSIAVDPSVIPLGTVLEVEGYGRGVAEDTGGAIRGRRIDVWKSSESACVEWGRRPVEVFVV